MIIDLHVKTFEDTRPVKVARTAEGPRSRKDEILTPKSFEKQESYPPTDEPESREMEAAVAHEQHKCPPQLALDSHQRFLLTLVGLYYQHHLEMHLATADTAPYLYYPHTSTPIPQVDANVAERVARSVSAMYSESAGDPFSRVCPTPTCSRSQMMTSHDYLRESSSSFDVDAGSYHSKESVQHSSLAVDDSALLAAELLMGLAA
eukprot:gene21535-27570_t